MGPAVTVSDDALLGVLAAFRTFDAEQKKRVQAALKSTAVPLFRAAYTQRQRTRQQQKAAGIGSVTVSAAGRGTLKGYGTGSKVLSGGLNAAGGDHPWIEFGSNRAHGQRGQLPRFVKGGRIFYPAVNATATTIARVWMGVTYDMLREIANG